MLRSGFKGKSAIDLASDILSLRSSIRSLTNLTLEELTQIKGIKQAKALEILACFELSKRIASSKLDERIMIDHPSKIVDWLNNKIGYMEQEHFMIVFLNHRNEIISNKNMYIGLSNSCNVSVREVYMQALRMNASKLLLVHNHPSGNVEPSREDIDVTNQFVEAGKLCGIQVIDHIIVSHNRYFSFKEKLMIAS